MRDHEDLASLLRRYRYHYANEDELQQAIDAVLDANDVAHQREVVLGPAGRIDFTVDTDAGLVGVEVKIKGSAGDVERQLRRYVDAGLFVTVLLVTSRSQQAAAIAADALPGVEVVVLR